MTLTVDRPTAAQSQQEIVLMGKANQCVDTVLPKVKNDILYHVWNELNNRASSDPRAQFILDSMKSGEPLRHFFGSTLTSMGIWQPQQGFVPSGYGGGGEGGGGGSTPSGGGGGGTEGGGSTTISPYR